MRLALVLLLVACAPRAKTRCEEVCAREAQCAAQLHVADGEYSECADVCQQLERDPNARTLIEEHVACVKRAATCHAALACP